VKYANKLGAIVVVAAGNSNRNASDFSPVNSKGVIGVSAVDSDLNRAEFSNYVQDLPLGVAAPGVGIYSTIPNNRYETYNGTSMATPYVAGLLGLMKSIKPNLTTEEAYKILNESGMDTRNSKLTGKFIQPLGAVKRIK
jgi:thermitase